MYEDSYYIGHWTTDDSKILPGKVRAKMAYSWPGALRLHSSNLAYGGISSLSKNFITQPYEPLIYIF